MASRTSLQQIFSVISSNGLSKCTGEALQIFDPSTRQWVKANPMHLEVTHGRRKRFGGLEVRGLQDSSQHLRLPRNNNGEGYSRPTSTKEWRRAAPVDDVVKHLQNASGAMEAVAILKNHLQQSIAIDSNVYVDVLQRCFEQKDLASAKQVHDCIMQSEMEQIPYVANNLLRVYIRCGRLREARQVFDKLVKKTVVTWNSMIGGYAEYYRASDAIEVYDQMSREGGLPNEITFLSVLKACANPVYLKWGTEIHSHIQLGGFQSDVRVGSALVHMYVKCSAINDARLVFDAMVDRNVISWNVMIGGLAKHGRGHDAFSLFLQMQGEGFTPNATTYVNILSAKASDGALDWVKEVHRHALKAGLESNVRVASALVHMYAKSDSCIENAKIVFNKMTQRDLISWNVMISGLAQHGHGYEAFSLFLQMQSEGFHPDATTYLSILNTRASAGALEWVQEVHSQATKAGLVSDVRLSNALIHMYAKSGSMRDAQLVFDQMKRHDIISWNAMIGGLAQDGCGLQALQLFAKMKLEGLKPDGCSFLAVLSACSHAGLVDEGRCQFLSMTQDFGIEPELEHYNCMVDMFGRAGLVEDAKRLILNMPLEPDEVTWGAFLGACRTFSNGEMGEVAAKERIKLKPLEASTYAVLTNIYAAADKWGHVSLVRSMMQERGIHKEPGRSWIEIDNKIQSFVVGDTSHPEAQEIYAQLHSLTEN